MFADFDSLDLLEREERGVKESEGRREWIFIVLFRAVINVGKIYESSDNLLIMNIPIFSIGRCQLYLLTAGLGLSPPPGRGFGLAWSRSSLLSRGRLPPRQSGTRPALQMTGLMALLHISLAGGAVNLLVWAEGGQEDGQELVQRILIKSNNK